MKQFLFIAITFILLMLGYFFGYKSVIPSQLEQSYIADKAVTSWQPTNESALSSIIRVTAEFSLGFEIPYETIAQGHQVAAPHSLFRLSPPHQFGFELNKEQVAEFTLKSTFGNIKILLRVNHTDVYLNNQRPNNTSTEWTFQGEVIVRAGRVAARGTITVIDGSYEYVGYEGHRVRSVTVQAWSDKKTGYKGAKGQTILLESATEDSSFNLVIFDPVKLQYVKIMTQWYTFWKFDRSGELVIGALDKPLAINILPQD